MRTYQNPVYHGYFADPFVWKHRGKYFAAGTGAVGNFPTRRLVGVDGLPAKHANAREIKKKFSPAQRYGILLRARGREESGFNSINCFWKIFCGNSPKMSGFFSRLFAYFAGQSKSHAAGVVFEPLLGFEIIRTSLRHLRPESRRVIEFTQMHQFVDDDVIANGGRQLNQPPIERNRSILRARTPATSLVTHHNLRDRRAKFFGQLFNALDQFDSGQIPQMRFQHRPKIILRLNRR